MSFFENLRRKATGILGDAGDPMGEASMDVNYDSNQTFTSPYFGKEIRNPNSGLKEFQPVPFKINAQGKKVAADGSLAGMIKQGAAQASSSRAAGAEDLGINNDQAKRFFGMDLAGIRSQWKDKGGFEALMANPMFTLGLGLMKSSATGQPISQSLLNNAVQAGAISSKYADRIRSRKQAPIEATAENIENTKQLLRTMDIEEPNFFERAFGKIFKGENKQAQYEEAAEAITIELEKEMQRLQKDNKSGKPLVFDTAFKKKIIRRLVKEGKIKKKGGIRGITKATVEAKSEDPFKQAGGPVTQNESYVVGETGPEIFTPKQSGNVISNDDSNVVNMLLEANPQLKNVSLDRATKILKNRFPDYF